jgi:hypothetical protein
VSKKSRGKEDDDVVKRGRRGGDRRGGDRREEIEERKVL